ncbi:C9orf72-like domain containing protein [Trichuris trichiura]|uniref:C9orf72-like domain containing protein n=1 Tax=Trichuris trichiura TaxID=36087 RepID=A0A077Z9H3_TRITR|nr:C9orf72-like domain containing protein [Trichuris trichiura]
MEAEVFEIVDVALRNKVKLAKLPVRYFSGIERVVWSVWNYIVGPELKFVWEVVAGDLETYRTCPPAANECSAESSDCVESENVLEATSARLSSASTSLALGEVEHNFRSANECPLEIGLDVAEGNIRQEQLYNGEDDDRYIAMHTLCSEIYNPRNSSDVLRLPDRRFAVGAYIFMAKHQDRQAIHSIALVLNEKRVDWFLKLQPFLQPFFEDFVTKLRIAILVDKSEELLSRMTSELNYLLLVLGILERRSFAAVNFDIADTHFAEANSHTNDFLARCVSAHLQCQCHTVVVGNNSKPVNRVNIDSIMKQALYSRWPFCVIDVDEHTVFHSLPWRKHDALRKEMLLRDARKILMQDLPTRRLKIELKAHSVDDSIVIPFLNQMDQLPYQNVIRTGFSLQFLNSLAMRALALDVYARVESDEGADRSKLSEKSICRALDIKLKGDFWIAIAVADLMRPKLAEYLLKSR